MTASTSISGGKNVLLFMVQGGKAPFSRGCWGLTVGGRGGDARACQWKGRGCWGLTVEREGMLGPVGGKRGWMLGPFGGKGGMLGPDCWWKGGDARACRWEGRDAGV